jgi:hypothetical protein
MDLLSIGNQKLVAHGDHVDILRDGRLLHCCADGSELNFNCFAIAFNHFTIADLTLQSLCEFIAIDVLLLLYHFTITSQSCHIRFSNYVQ